MSLGKKPFKEGSSIDESPTERVTVAILSRQTTPVTGAVANNVSTWYRKVYTWCTLFASLGGFMFGFDTGSIGPVIVMPQFKNQFDPLSPVLQGLIVSCILIPASLSSIIAGPIADRISRTRTFAIGGAVFALGSILECATLNLSMLFVGRCIAGIGEGLFLSVVIVYICEIAPSAIRGRLTCTVQLYITCGIASGYFMSYYTVRLDSSLSWRLLFGLQAVIGIIFSLGSFFLPHSPRWLQHIGREDEATTTWITLGFTEAETEKETEKQSTQSTTDGTVAKANKVNQWSEMWKKDVRHRTILGIFLMAMNQACGIDGVLYYAPILFSQAGLASTEASFLASGITGIVNIICTLIAQIFTDKWGRRPSMIWGGVGISVSMLTIGSLYASGVHSTPAGSFIIIAFIYLFVISFAMSWAIVIRIYCSETQPMHTRAAASSLGQCINWVVNWLIAFSTPLFLSRSNSGPYFMFGAFSVVTVFVCLAFQPESKGVDLEDLDTRFKISPWRKMVGRLRAGSRH